MKHIWPAVIAGAIAVLALTPPAVADCGHNPPLSQFRALLPNPSGATDVVLSESASEVFIAAYNATPPTTEILADRVFLHFVPAAPNGLVAFVSKGCVAAYQFAPVAVLRAWMDGHVPPRANQLRGRT